MASRIASIHWEARWRENHEDRTETFKDRVSNLAEAKCRTFAMQKALELGQRNNANEYTKVECFEVTTHEEQFGFYTNRGVLQDLNHPRMQDASVGDVK